MSNAFETEILELIFNNSAIVNIGDAGGLQPSATAGSLYVSLHTSNPDETGNQGTGETVYTNYARVGVARSGAGWTVSGNTATNAALIQFPQCGATGATITHIGIGVSGTAADSGVLLFSGALSSPLTVANLIQPQFAAGDLDVVGD
jgi:nucleoside phosphorylase